MRWSAWVVIGVLVVRSEAGDPQSERVHLEDLSYAQLAKEIRELKGKVVLVDVWGEFCPPCKKEFPRFVVLHQKFGGSGLAAVSVSVDDPTDEDAKTRALAFLTAQKATCRNVLLSDGPDVWQKKWKIAGPPCVFLFDRDGKLINRWADRDIDYQAIEKRVAELLK